MLDEERKCSGCYDSISGPWCDNCDQWPCICVSTEEETMTEDEFISNLARDAYHAYCHDAVWTSVKGDPLPQWEETTKEIQQHWKVAALHIVRVARNSETL